MKYEISYEKNNVPQTIIIDGSDAATCEAYFKTTRTFTAFYGISVPDDVKPGQPVVIVPNGWTAPTAEPAEDAESAAEPEDDDNTPAEETQVQIANKLHVSARNSKLGRVPNMSLTPGRTCSACACKTCLCDGCYAMKSYRQYPATRTAWDDNTALALQDLPAMERGLMAYFTAGTAPTKKKPITFFRLHVGGDFVSTAYAWMWYRIAQAFPGVHFLAFTKQWDVVRPVPFYRLPNFALRLSDWPGTEIPEDLRKLYHVAWMNDGTRPADTFPAGCLQCPGNCETCGACWGYDGDTVFDKH